MPQIAETHEVLDGRGTIYRHQGEQRWRYREYDNQRRKYRTGLIASATNVEEAKVKAVELVLKWTSTKQQLKPRATAKNTNLTIEDEVKLYLRRVEEMDAASESIDVIGRGNSIKQRKVRALALMLEYLKSKRVTYAKQLKVDTFDDYIMFRKGMRKLTKRTELQHIKVFLVHHLRRKGLITNELAKEPELVPKVKILDEDLDANPSISQRDYNVINLYIRGKWRNDTVYKTQMYFKRYFHTYVHLLWNSGCRPGEMLKVRMKDVTITNKPRYSESDDALVDDYKCQVFIRKSKTGKQRTVLLTSNAADNLISFLKFQKDYVTMKPESLVFGKPDHQMERTYSMSHITESWIDIIRTLTNDGYLEGNKFSERRYTLYSLRSSWIENMITKGTDVYLIARLAGNSVAIIQKYYDRHDVMKRAEEIQAIQRGRIGITKKEIDVDIFNL